MKVNSDIFKLAEYFNIKIAAWRRSKIDYSNKSYESENELNVATNKFRSLLYNRLNASYIAGGINGEKTWFDKDWSDKHDIIVNKYPITTVTILSQLNRKQLFPIYTSGFYDHYDGIISVTIHVYPGTVFTEDFIKEMVDKACITFRHELQHYKQYSSESKEYRREAHQYTYPTDDIVKYYLQDLESDAYITSFFEKAMSGIESGEINVQELIEQRLWVIRSALITKEVPEDMIRRSLKRIRNKWTGWLKNKYNIDV